MLKKFGLLKKRRTFAIPNNWWIRLTVRTEDSQSSNRSSILLSTTTKKDVARHPFFVYICMQKSALYYDEKIYS